MGMPTDPTSTLKQVTSAFVRGRAPLSAWKQAVQAVRAEGHTHRHPAHQGLGLRKCSVPDFAPSVLIPEPSQIQSVGHGNEEKSSEDGHLGVDSVARGTLNRWAVVHSADADLDPQKRRGSIGSSDQEGVDLMADGGWSYRRTNETDADRDHEADEPNMVWAYDPSLDEIRGAIAAGVLDEEPRDEHACRVCGCVGGCDDGCPGEVAR